jgi:hypothetical protein
LKESLIIISTDNQLRIDYVNDKFIDDLQWVIRDFTKTSSEKIPLVSSSLNLTDEKLNKLK